MLKAVDDAEAAANSAAAQAATATASGASACVPTVKTSPLSSWEEELLRSDSKSSFLGNAVGLTSRARRLTDYVRQRPERTIGLVSHASFLDVLTTDAALEHPSHVGHQLAGLSK